MNDDDIPMPATIKALPVNRAGYPIPWFVDRDADVDGQPDFRVASRSKLRDAVRFHVCWVCGVRRGVHASFVVGPMCAVNRTSAEPPCHRDCAIYSARACPFLATPTMTRRERHLPEHRVDPPGIMLTRNPGVALVYTTRTFRPYRVGNGVLFDMGQPESKLWFAHGRAARAGEILASIESGLPALTEIAEGEGPAAVADLEQRVAELTAEIEQSPLMTNG